MKRLHTSLHKILVIILIMIQDDIGFVWALIKCPCGGV